MTAEPYSDLELCEAAGCPYCGAEAGMWCTDTRTGEATVTLHQSRQRDAGLLLVGEQPETEEDEPW